MPSSSHRKRSSCMGHGSQYNPADFTSHSWNRCFFWAQSHKITADEVRAIQPVTILSAVRILYKKTALLILTREIWVGNLILGIHMACSFWLTLAAKVVQSWSCWKSWIWSVNSVTYVNSSLFSNGNTWKPAGSGEPWDAPQVTDPADFVR